MFKKKPFQPPTIDNSNQNDYYNFHFSLSVYTGENDNLASKELIAQFPFNNIEQAINWGLKHFKIKANVEIENLEFTSISIMEHKVCHYIKALIALDIERKDRIVRDWERRE